MKRKMKYVAIIICYLQITAIAFYCIPISCEMNFDLIHREIAYYWAPIWYQDTASSSYKADFITNIDYDGDWIGNNNWDNLYSFDVNATIYYSVIETERHWFLGYYDFHPRDWAETNDVLISHENDFEGVLLVIEKDQSWGKFLCMVTRAHQNIHQYTDDDQSPSKEVTSGHEIIDGDVEFKLINDYDIELPFSGHDHPIVYVESHGHGVYGAERWEVDGFPEGDGVIYKPKGIAEKPESGNDQSVSYKLEPIKEIWDMRFDPNDLFEDFSRFDGNDFGNDKAIAPWGWDDNSDGATFTGEFFYNPADLIDVHFNRLGYFDFSYTYNPYAVIIKFDRFRVLENKDGISDSSDGYFNLFMFDGEGRIEWSGYEDGVLDGDSGSQESWILNDMEKKQWYDISDLRPFYGIHYPDMPYFGIQCKDWDGGVDDWLMEPKKRHWYGHPGSMQINDDIKESLYEGYHLLSWGKSEVYIYLMVEEDDDLVYTETPTSTASSNLVSVIGALILGISLLYLRINIHDRRKMKTN